MRPKFCSAENGYRLEWITMCPGCGSGPGGNATLSLSDIFAKDSERAYKWNASICGSCKTCFLNPRPTADTIGSAYAHYYTHSTADSENLAVRRSGLLRLVRRIRESYTRLRVSARPKYRDLILGFFAFLHPGKRKLVDIGLRYAFRCRSKSERPSRILDVGAGDGAFISLFSSLGWDCFAVEPDRSSAVYRFLSPDRICDSIHEVHPELNCSFDMVTFSHVLEHIHHPLEALKRSASLLRNGGGLWIDVPNPHSKLAGIFGSYWRGYEAPRHLVLFDKDRLLDILLELGFAHIDVIRRPDVFDFMRVRSNEILLQQMSGHKEVMSVSTQALNAASALRGRDRDAEFLTIFARKTVTY